MRNMTYLFFKITLALLFFNSSNSINLLAQDKPPGFLGKRNIITFNMSSAMKIIGSFGTYPFKRMEYGLPNSSGIDLTNNLFRHFTDFSISRIYKRNRGFGFSYSRELIKSNHYHEFLDDWIDMDDYRFRVITPESPEFYANSLRLNYIWTNKNLFLPVGFKGIIGLGSRFVRLNDNRNYMALLQINENNNILHTFRKVNAKPEGVEDIKFTALELAYTGNVAYPISKSLLLEFGFTLRTAYTLKNDVHIVNKEFYGSDTDISYTKLLEREFYTQDFHKIVSMENWLNLFSMNLGFSYSF